MFRWFLIFMLSLPLTSFAQDSYKASVSYSLAPTPWSAFFSNSLSTIPYDLVKVAYRLPTDNLVGVALGTTSDTNSYKNFFDSSFDRAYGVFYRHYIKPFSKKFRVFAEGQVFYSLKNFDVEFEQSLDDLLTQLQPDLPVAEGEQEEASTAVSQHRGTAGLSVGLEWQPFKHLVISGSISYYLEYETKSKYYKGGFKNRFSDRLELALVY